MRRPARLLPWTIGGATVLAATLAAWLLLRDGRHPRAPLGPRECTVTALWHNPDDPSHASGVSRVTIRVEPKDVPGARVGFVEDESQGTGETWRASAWMATVVASLTSGIDLQQYTPTFTVSGRIDGPSAGGLLTVAVLSLLSHQGPASRATLTGTIAPDGTIGPVSGLAPKVEAAAKAGLRLVLIPRGQAHEVDPRTRKATDLVALGRQRGVRVREVTDVYEAYRELTGRALDTDAAPGPEEPALPEAVAKDTRAQAEAWLARYAREAADCRARSARTGAETQEQLAAAQRTARRARDLLRADSVAAAHDRAVSATLQAAAALESVKALEGLSEGGIAGAVRSIQPRGDRANEIGLTIGRIATHQVDSIDGWIAAADAFGTAAQAQGLRAARLGLARGLAGAPEDAGTVAAVLRAAVLAAMDRHVLQIAEDRASLVGSRDGPRPRRDPAFSGWPVTMERAATSGLGYFDAVALDESARGMGVHPEVLRRAMEYGDLTYLIAESSLAALPELSAQMTRKRNGEAARLGASIGAYAAASALVARFYSLRVQIGPEGQVTGVSDPKALERMEAFAAGRAGRDIALARSRGLEAGVAAYYCQVAREYEAGSTADRLEALQYYWQAGLYARLAAVLAQT